jgi:hypothetical protein
MRLTTIVLVLLFATKLAGQEKMLSCEVLDSTSRQPVQFAHVMNLSGESQAISDIKGHFTIAANVGDTILVSIVGYQRTGWQVKEDWFEKTVKLSLPQDTIMLNSVTVHDIPPEHIFRQRIMDHQPEDSSFWYHGMPKPVVKEDITLNEKVIKNPLFMATHPLTALYYNTSKQEKERRKYHSIKSNELLENRVNRKYNREWVQDVTGLEGNQLTDFIAYCNYSLEYLDKTPLYLIREDVIAKLFEFKKEQKS